MTYEIIWGYWENWESATRYVRAEGLTQEEAKKILSDFEKIDEPHEIKAINDEPIEIEVCDCPYDEDCPCDNPECPHLHMELVWAFEIVFLECFICGKEEINMEYYCADCGQGPLCSIHYFPETNTCCDCYEPF